MNILEAYIFIKRYPFSLLVGEFSHCVVNNVNQKSKYTQNDNVKASYQMALSGDFDQFKIEIDQMDAGMVQFSVDSRTSW